MIAQRQDLASVETASSSLHSWKNENIPQGRGSGERWSYSGRERPVVVRKKKLFIKWKNSEIEVLEQTVPSQSAEGLAL